MEVLHTTQFFLDLALLDKNGDIIVMGSGSIYDIDAYETKYFRARAFTSSDYELCDIQVSSVTDKS